MLPILVMIMMIVMIMMLVIVKTIMVYGDHYNGDDGGDHMVI